MDANDSTPGKGESASGESYPQLCVRCETEWTHFGSIEGSETKITCPSCGFEATSAGFLRWFLVEECSHRETVTVEVDADTRAAIDLCIEQLGWDRTDAVNELVSVFPRVGESHQESDR